MTYIKAAEREGQIVAAGIRVLTEVGVPAMTLRAVAREADIPLGTLHYVFPSKEQLLNAILSTVMEQSVAAIRETLITDQGVEHAIRQGVADFWDTLASGGIGLQILQYELATYSLRADANHGLARAEFEYNSALITELYERAAEAAGERCAIGYDSLGRITLAVVDGLLFQYIARPDPDRASRDLGHAIDMLVLLADPQPVASRRRRR